ncbi:hypothetical protein BDV98DRAFT_568618 [Pterulicium gracile]|uniref:Uncharacterized protein n=1 Tax=Pterulicium gracile TaxID=1884261 RepID=A0A5C3QFF5_9AGAR|nr:hypothetical protein BDV98DRAFT_568618 [Pterula gracilis]
MASKETAETKDCSIAEILQFWCDFEQTTGKPQVHCYPIPRMYRICKGRSTEITKITRVDASTGEVDLPSAKQIKSLTRTAKSWREVLESRIDSP